MKRRKLPYWFNWIAAFIVLAILFTVFTGEIQFVLFGEVTEDNYGNSQYESVKYKSFTRIGMIWQMLLHTGIGLVAGFVVRGWVGVTITDIYDEEKEKER